MKNCAAALLLMAALCLTLAACARTPQPAPAAGAQPSASPETPPQSAQTPAPAPAPMRVDALNVEFAAAGHGEDVLLTLQKEFPAALIDALGAQNVEVGRVSVTFGTSGEATQTALQNGAVQLAFLPAGDYLPYRGGMVVAVENGKEADLALGLVVAAASDDSERDERFTAAMRDALGALAPTLASYTADVAQGRYAFDAARLDELSALYEAEERREASHNAP